MTRKKKLLFSALILITMTFVPLYSQEPENEEVPLEINLYSLGDKNFSINLGLFFPLFFLDPTPASGSSAVSDTNLTLGGTGSLVFEAYLNNNIKIGGELGIMFAFSPNDNPFYMVPITARVAYEFHFGQFSMPIYMGLGMNIMTYDDETNVQLLMKPGISLYWNFDSSWSFGGNLVYWIAPEFIPDHSEYDRFGNFLDFTISAQYHF